MSVNSKMTAIADAIRAKTGGTNTLTLDEMAVEIAGISGGGGEYCWEKYEVIKPPVVPSGYAQLDYIESTGTQYIDTGYIFGTQNIKIDLDFEFTKDYAGSSLFGSMNTGTSRFNIATFGNPHAFYAGTSTGLLPTSLSLNNRYALNVQAKNGVLTSDLDGSVSTANYAGQLDNTRPFTLFAFDYGGELKQFSSARFYSCKIYDNDVLVRDYVPSMRKSDKVVGMYDLVNNQFYGNAGTGVFAVGEDVLGHLVGYVVSDDPEEYPDGGMHIDGYYYAHIGGNGQNLPEIGTTLEDCTWEEINAVSAAGIAADYWQVGDTKTITVGNEVQTVEIVGFAHDNLADGNGKAGITFGMVNCLSEKYKMNNENINKGGWGDCGLRRTLQNTIYPLLSSDLKAVIRTVKKITSAGSENTAINVYDDTLFLFSEIEVFGTASNSVSGEGSQYSRYVDTNSRIKKISGTAADWWLRSPRLTGATGFCRVGVAGGANYYPASTLCGVAFGFCV